MRKYFIAVIVLGIVGVGAYYFISETGRTFCCGPEEVSSGFYEDKEKGISFEYPKGWHVFDKNGALILLKQETYPDIASENYALGDQISIWVGAIENFHNKPATREEYLANELQENMFSGKPTSHTSFKRDGFDVDIITHANPDLPQTLEYLFFSSDTVYRFYLYPYEPAGQNAKDFEHVVESWKLLK